MFTQADVDYVNCMLKAIGLPEDASIDDGSIVFGSCCYQFFRNEKSGVDVYKEYVIPGGYWEPDYFDVDEIHNNAPSLFAALQVVVIDHYTCMLKDADSSHAEAARWADLEQTMAEQDVTF
jgi:hypothetical protein